MKEKIMILLPTDKSSEKHNEEFWETEIFKRFQEIEHDTQKIGVLITVQNSDYEVMDITIDEENIKKVGSKLENDNNACIILRHFLSDQYRENKHSSDALTQIIRDKCNLILRHDNNYSSEQKEYYEEKLDTNDFSRNATTGYWPNFKNLIDVFLEGGRIKSDADFEKAWRDLYEINEEELLISMKILFLPAYLTSISNRSDVSIDSSDRNQLKEMKTTEKGIRFWKKWLDSEQKNEIPEIGQYFEEDGALKEDKKENFCNAYKEFCKIDHIPNA